MKFEPATQGGGVVEPIKKWWEEPETPWWDKYFSKSKPLEPKNGVSPDQWEHCYRAALRRLSITINHRELNSPRTYLAKDDSTLRDETEAIDWLLFRYSSERPDLNEQGTSRDLIVSEVEDFFYGALSLPDAVPHSGQLSRPRILGNSQLKCRPAYRVTWAFLRTSFEGLISKDIYPHNAMGFPIEIDPVSKGLIQAVSYIVKNLWHNYVHVQYQRINEGNFGEFGGQARHQSDFEADNLATILLARSYDMPVIANSLRATTDPIKSIIHLVRRSRCNDVFAERARIRRESESKEERVWRYRRAIAIYTSGRLLASGRAPASLSVYLSNQKKRNKIVVEVNGNYIRTGKDELDSFIKSRKDRTEDENEARREHLRQVAIDVDSQYLEILQKSKDARKRASDMLDVKLRSLGIDWSSTDNPA